MSRHRNVRNLTHDDYYDDYDDDYDDDYYEEEEDDDYYYQQQQEQRREREQQLRQEATIPTMSSSTRMTAPTSKKNGPGYAEKERIILEMNFSKEQARWALDKANGNVQDAVNALLNLGSAGTALSTPKKEPPPASDISKPTPPTSGISKPPPGFTRPSGTKTPPPTVASKVTKPDTTTQQEDAERKPTLTPPRERKTTDYGALPQVPEEVLQAIEQQRSRLSMVVLGHVDAGKSTLMGQVLLQLGRVEKRTVTKYQKQAAELGKASFALAWVMDEDDSERERGVTMEVGTKYATTEKHDLIILDAPGHADFIPAMITGAASADVGLLVVAATPGEFEAGFEVGKGQHSGGQTREHVILARGLGVSQLLVAVNKLDATEPQWSQSRFDDIQSRLMPFLQSNGFQAKRIRFVPISGLNGVNVKDKASLVPELDSWYKGPTLLEAIDAFVPAQRNASKPLRVIVTDVYAEGKGVVTRGRVVQGVVQAGEKLVVLPIGDDAAVTRIDHGSDVDRLKYAVAGDAVELVLSGIDIARLSPGCVLSHPHLQLRPPVRKKMQAKILVMEELDVPIIRGATVLLHMHSIDVPAVLSKLVATTKRDGSIKKERPRVLTGGASATVEISLSEKIVMEEYAECRALGRFVLRRGGDTVALGIIEKIIT